MRGVVYYGEKFVEVSDGSATLGDICGSFGLSSDIAGICIKNRVSGRVVVTLPFETLPTVENLPDDEDNTYELCVPVNDGDEERMPTTDDMTEVLRQLVQLGAASLLTTQSESHGSLDPYDPRASPGLMMRTIYPPSVYCPYRHRGDPLKVRGRFDAAPIADIMRGSPYVSAVEPYTVEKATEMTLRQRPDLIPQSEEEACDILKGLVTVATQARAMIAMANMEEDQYAPLDVKPDLKTLQSV